MAVTDLVAAATRYTQKFFGTQVAQPDSAWQNHAWGYHRDTPEVAFAATWVGTMMGRSRLYAGKRLPDGTVDPLPPEHDASRLVATIGGGPAGQAQILTEHGPKLLVTGEAWTIIVANGEWHIASTKEVRRTGGRDITVEIDGKPLIVPMEPDDPARMDPEAPTGIRVWQPDAERYINAYSPIRPSFAILEELRLLNAAVAAIAKSRLTGRGILFIPQGTGFPNGTQGGALSPDLLQEIIKVAETAYMQPDSAAAGVPIILEVPSEFIGQVQHLTFESQFDEIAVKLRDECRRRFADSMEFSPSVASGDSQNHWSGWLQDETSVRQAVVPRLNLVCNAYTTQWLIPALQVMGVPDAAECLIWHDDSDLRVRTDRSQTALELHARGEITGDALRRETNFDDADKPSTAEQERALLIGIIQQAPSLAPVILPMLGINVPGLDAVPIGEEVPTGDVAPVVELPITEDPGTPRVSEGLMAAADGLVARAMERAGQKLKSSQPRAQRGDLEKIEASAVHVATGCTEDDIERHRLLDKAWNGVPAIASRYGVDPSDLTACLDRYTRQLLCAGVEHAWEQTPAVLAPLVASNVVEEPEPVAEAV